MVAIVGSIESGGLIEPWRIAYQNNRLVLFKSVFYQIEFRSINININKISVQNSIYIAATRFGLYFWVKISD